ncbi:MAG: Calx-beta domain-containing protein [Vicinamibacterales bacterium]
MSVALLQRASADNFAQTLPFFQDWTNTALITVNDSWSVVLGMQPGVPGIEGFRGDGLTSATGVNPQTVLAADTPGVLDVNANQTNPNTFATGGVAEFHIANPVVALNGSGTARAPYLLLHVNTTGRENVRMSYVLRDLDGSVDNAVSPVALHYRVGGVGLFTDVPAAFVADASTGPSDATLVTPVSADLPAAVNNQPLVQLRIMTTDAVGNDEWIGVDDILVQSDLIPGFPMPPSGVGAASPSTVVQGAQTLLTVAVTPGTNPTSTGLTVTANLTPIGGTASQALFDDGMGGDAMAGDNIFSFNATVASAVTPGSKTLLATISDDQGRAGSAAISLAVEEFVPFLAIHDIQGAGATSDYVSQRVTTTGIVTGIRPNSFYIQTPDAEADGDPDTSDGLLIFRTTLPGQIHRGDLVRVTGRVVEFIPASDPESRPVTELGQLPTFEVLFSNQALPAPVTLTAADAPAGSPNLDLLERFEGMRVHVEELTVVAPTGFQSLNETGLPVTAPPSTSNGVFVGVVSGVARPFREPGLDPFEPEPSGVPPCVPLSPCVPRFDGNPERIRVDSDAQLGGVRLELAAGQIVEDLIGPLDYESATWSIALDPPPPTGFVVRGSQTAVPVTAPSPSQFTIASFNLQRLFDTVNDPGISEPVLTAARFAQRLNKLSVLVRDVLKTPDILGVSEAENIGVLQALATTITADALAAGQPDPAYGAYLEEGNDVGGIDVGFLVKSTRVAVMDVVQEGKGTTYTFPPGPGGLEDILNDRPPLVLRAQVTGPSGVPFPITVIANHLRSLLDVTDPVDGPRVRFKRRAQAEFLATLIRDRQVVDPHERIIVIGDMNAFQFNDGLVDSIGTIQGTPVPADQVVLPSPDLFDPDLINLVERVPADQRYSFVFNGNAQELDHILITQNLEPRFVALQYGRANADFPESLRNDPTRPERTSDHDPLVAYFVIPVSLSIDDVTVTEGDQSVTQARFTVTLQGSSEEDVTVEFTTEDDGGQNGAVGGVDYITNAGTLVFPQAVNSQTIVVDVIGERLFEPDELFFVRLSHASPNAIIARAAGTGTITNDDPEPSLSIGNAEVAEGNGAPTTATFTVSLSNPSASTISVAFATADGTAQQPLDYAARSGVLEFAPGETAQTVAVTVNGDVLDEPDETFAVNLSNAEKATILDGQGIGTIRDNDPRPTIRIRNARADEPAEGTALMPFRVELSAPSGQTVTVDFRTFNLTAVAGRDYEARTGTVTFAPGETEATIEVPILADHRREFVEFFLVLLYDPVNGIAADSIGIGIIDDARGPRITSFSPGSGDVGDTVTITGENFMGALHVTFNGVPTLFHLHSPTRIRAIVPRGALSGPISVTTRRGTDTSAADFTVLR